MSGNIVPLDQLGMNDVPRVGGKNASLGEMISNLGSLGVEVPGGFATTASAFDRFLEQAGIRARIHERLERLDTDDVKQLAVVGAEIRGWIIDAPLPAELQSEISASYRAMAIDGKDATVAVRSSATAEDLPDASFAGQQETYLNISGIEQVMHAINWCLPRCSTTVRYPTGCTRASLTPMSRCRREFSAWCAATWPPAA